MRKLHKTFLFLMMIYCPGVMAQASLDSLLVRVESASPVLINARQMMEARRVEASTGLTPANPEVEFAYLWGSPAELGDRTDFAVTQTIDFPTVYTSRNRLSDINKEQAVLQYEVTRQEVMLRAQKAWIDRVHLNKVRLLLESRLSYARTVAKGFERKVETGEANRLQLNQARMKVTSLENEISLLEQKFSHNTAEIRNLTGNLMTEIRDTLLPGPSALFLDTLLLDYRQGYLNKAYQSEVARRDQEVDVVFNKKLPKLKAGYYSESILGTKLRGIQAGISIPLWENAHAVNSAKAQLAAARTGAENFWMEKQNDITRLFEQWSLLKARVEEVESLLRVSNDEVLLRQAMEAGEISLTEYFYESDFYFQNVLNLLEFKKEMLLTEAELRKVYY